MRTASRSILATLRTKDDAVLPRQVGRRIGLLRRSCPAVLVSQRRLASRLGISLSTLRKIERGERSMTLGVLETICRELRVTPHALVCGRAMEDPLDAALRPFLAFIRRQQVRERDAQALARMLEAFWSRFVGP